ncbi:MAG: PspC domain-containing protein, partial [Dehalococcoidia bacterium]|nr:PspC domain-containing protein [Dehalococcoidia bacterium]
MARKLYRSTTNRKIWGVCGGLGDYFDIDPVLVRIIFVALAFPEGLGILLYVLAAIFVT